MSTDSVMPSNHLILCHPLLPLPSLFPGIMVFSNELALCIRWPNYWSFIFSISPSKEYSGLISFKVDWFDLLAFQGLSGVFWSTTVQKELCLLCCPALTTTHDYWKDHSLDSMVFCRQSDVCFLTRCHGFPAKKQSSSNFMTAVTIRTDFRAQEE